ncbi:E3 ubiquitin ligase RNF121-like [Oppia nitens]|uniref:E3 ubiquitin ligase RNF121-like n=1 Tax=Oppia nitens TaxID=1686743 RepID=UPI0023DC8AC2|nr:E3 ubiquitin ligase RNF121-like [Oppia nitens]
MSRMGHHFDENDGHIYHGIDINKVNLSSLGEAQREHLLLHEKHRGHESMHALMLLILIAAIVVAQVVLIYWRKKSPKSYQNVSMIGMWFVPFILSVYNHWFRFVAIWLAITLVTCALISKPLINKQLNTGSIPRLIYKWFYFLYSFSSIVAVTGYLVIMATLVGINMLLGIKPNVTLDLGFLLLFYGIYYGVLTRDFTDFLVDLLAANIGYYQPQSSLPSKQLNSTICAICGRNHSENNEEKTYTLSCGHIYHEYCIYGWCLVGKKQVCPFCREKVDLKKLFSSLPFQKPHFLYGNLLDFIRYLIVWQPIIIFAVQCFNYILGLE